MDYLEFFKLKDRPFKSPLESKFFFQGWNFKQTLNRFTSTPLAELSILEGPVGVGKSSVIKRLPQALGDQFKTVPILNSTVRLGTILSEALSFLGLGHKCQASTPDESLLGFFQNEISEMIKGGLGLIVVVDEAQHLSQEALNDLMTLTKLEPSWSGKTNLTLVSPDGYQWQERGLSPQTERIIVEPLDLNQTGAYLTFKLKAAGSNKEIFSKEALLALYGRTGGLPGKIDSLAEKAMIVAWGAGKRQVSAAHIASAKAALDNPLTIAAPAVEPAAGPKHSRLRFEGRAWKSLILAMGIVALLSTMIWWLTRLRSERDLAQAQVQVQEAPIPLAPVITATPAAKAALNEGPLGLPIPPPGLLTLPHNSLALVVDHDQRMARLWLGGLSGPGLKAEIAPPDFKGTGLYLVGRPKSKSSLIFHYPPAKQILTEEATKLWLQVETMLPQDLLPLMVGSDQDLFRSPPAGLEKLLSEKVANWTRNQEYKLSQAMSLLYSSTFSFYEPGHKPLSISRKNFKTALESESRAAGDVLLTVSPPLILLDPVDGARAWAIFNLKYDSKLRHDTGLRTLIFEKSLLNNDWLIVAELWIKQDSLND
ncbi:MAG: AAA family ATPase [Deltaproteobacteria bacterium]|jgi:type II secretory pathway predicted ATPase ExeA|nr:AAA family ATPase [Deltaproteobacteria bacterium]